MSTSLKLRKEEYSALGDFISVSLERDLAAISARFPKVNEAFRASFMAKLDEVKILESGLNLTEDQKNATRELYAELAVLNKELNFLSNYCKDANLQVTAVSALKKDLSRGNAEGAILKIESVKQFVVANQAALVEEGMASNFATVLETYKTSLETKNALQNSSLNARKTLTETNKVQYKELYDYIAKIMRYGKLVFNDSIVKEEYTTVKVVGKMRSAR